MTGPGGGRGHRPQTLRRAAAGAALCLLLAACPSASGGGFTAPPPTSSGGGGEIIVASGLDVTGGNGVRQRLIDAWNRTPRGLAHPARLVELPGRADQQRSQLLGALQSGGARYDVVSLDITWVPEFAAAGLITRLDHQVDLGADVIASVAATAAWDGHTYAVPFNADVGLLYYRPDHLAGAGVEQAAYPAAGMTWSRLRELVRLLDAAGAGLPAATYQRGWTSQLAAYEGLTANAVEAFASVGVRLTDADGHYTADPAALRTGLEELRERTDGQYTLPAALASHEPESLTDFASGRTAFLRHWPYAYAVLPQSLSGDRYAVAPLPGRAVLGGQNLAVSAASPRAAYALELITFLTAGSSERCLLDAGYAATRVSAYTDPEVRCPPAPPSTRPPTAPGPGVAEVRDMPRDDQHRPAYAETVLLPALRDAVQRPRTPYYGAFTRTLQSHVHAWLTDPDPPDTGRFAETLDRALAMALGGE